MRNLARQFLDEKGTFLLLVLTFLVLVGVGRFSELQWRRAYVEQKRSEVIVQTSVLRARLEGSIAANIQLARGLVASLSTEPDMDQERFEALARGLFEQGLQLRNVAAAPDFVIRLVYPLEGNERAIGLDYNRNAAQRAAALRVQETGALVIAGPLNLVQGGQGLIGRFPVFTNEGGTTRFWGIASAVIDTEKLYSASGITDPALPIDIALARNGPEGPGQAPFFGAPDVMASDPVQQIIHLPDGSWTISAIPKGGWQAAPPNLWLLRVAFLAALVLVLGPMSMNSRLLAERKRNLVELRRREAELATASRRLELALDTSRIGVWEYDATSGALIWDSRMRELYTLPAAACTGRIEDWTSRLHPDDISRASDEFQTSLSEGNTYHSEYRLQNDEGDIRHIRAIGQRFRDADNHEKIVGVNWDVSLDVSRETTLQITNKTLSEANRELESAKKRIEFISLHDPLTGLPNRRFLDQILTGLENDRHESEQFTTLLQIDLDGFKRVNDHLGHALGDALLVEVAELMKSTISGSDFLARTGGDEFVIVCRDALGDKSGRAEALAQTLVGKVGGIGFIGEHPISIGASIGIARCRGDGISPSDLMSNADFALYDAKNGGRNRCRVFDADMQHEMDHKRHIGQDLRAGIEQGQFEVFYQPQFDQKNLEIAGAEALVRWRHPTRGILLPQAFLADASKLELSSSIDDHVMQTVLADIRDWEAAGIDVPKVSINTSMERLTDPRLVDNLKVLDIQPDTISFEVLESTFIDGSDKTLHSNVDRIKQMGIDIEIDDFGTGYASIVSLVQLEPRRVKIARELVLPIVDSMASRRLLRSILEMARSLEIQVIAEGVETMEHVRCLRALRCDILQGFALSKPVPAADLVRLVRSRGLKAVS